MSYIENDNILTLLNNFIIDIIYKHKYFNDSEYNSVKNINNNLEIEKNIDSQTTIRNKIDVQHYLFYFLLEYIKNITSTNNKTTRTHL